MTLVTLPYRPQDGDPEDVSQIIADFDAILAVLNGDVRDDNISPAAGIDYAKLALTGQVKNSDIAAAAAIVGSKLAAGSVTDTQLASPNNSFYRTLSEVVGSVGAAGAVANGTYLFKSETAGATPVGTSNNVIPLVLGFDPADYVVAGKTLQLSLYSSLFVNATAAGATFKVGLYPITTSAGAANQINLDVGAVVAGSEVTFTTPGANTRSQGSSGDFAAPAQGPYAICVNVSGGPTNANHYSLFSTRLRMRSS